MTDIKSGTRVTATCTDGVEKVAGVLLEPGQEQEYSDERSVLPDGNYPDDYRFVRPETIKAVEPLSFIGPKPEPVEEPAVVLPFAVVPGIRSIIWDDNGEDLITVNGSTLTEEEDGELAALVVKLLNKHFGVE
jgi:hypothetical protein